MSEPGGQDSAATSNEPVAKKEPLDVRRKRRDRITSKLMYYMRPMNSKSWQSPQEPDPERLYSLFDAFPAEKNGMNLDRALSILLLRPPSNDTNLDIGLIISEIQRGLHLTERQIHDHISGITISQLEEMADIIERSGLPLRYAPTEEELLYELSLASGKSVTNLDAVTLEQFDDQSQSYPHHPTIEYREHRLFDLPIEDRNSGKKFYPIVERFKKREKEDGDQEPDDYYLSYKEVGEVNDIEEAKANFRKYKESLFSR